MHRTGHRDPAHLSGHRTGPFGLVGARPGEPVRSPHRPGGPPHRPVARRTRVLPRPAPPARGAAVGLRVPARTGFRPFLLRVAAPMAGQLRTYRTIVLLCLAPWENSKTP